MQGPQVNWLQDGKRLHLNHGPIDLIVEASSLVLTSIAAG